MPLFGNACDICLTGPQLPWVILWLGLATLIVGLIVLTRTSWGQSHPLRKCAALSLLVHLLLAAYATTVQIVTAGSPDGRSATGTINVTLVDDADSDCRRSAAKVGRLGTAHRRPARRSLRRPSSWPGPNRRHGRKPKAATCREDRRRSSRCWKAPIAPVEQIPAKSNPARRSLRAAAVAAGRSD